MLVGPTNWSWTSVSRATSGCGLLQGQGVQGTLWPLAASKPSPDNLNRSSCYFEVVASLTEPAVQHHSPLCYVGNWRSTPEYAQGEEQAGTGHRAQGRQFPKSSRHRACPTARPPRGSSSCSRWLFGLFQDPALYKQTTRPVVIPGKPRPTPTQRQSTRPAVLARTAKPPHGSSTPCQSKLLTGRPSGPDMETQPAPSASNYYGRQSSSPAAPACRNS